VLRTSLQSPFSAADVGIILKAVSKSNWKLKTHFYNNGKCPAPAQPVLREIRPIRPAPPLHSKY
jgi:hypothetical protein